MQKDTGESKKKNLEITTYENVYMSGDLRYGWTYAV